MSIATPAKQRLQTGILDREVSGGARRDRTDDLMLAKHALSQLSYGPVVEALGARAALARTSFCKFAVLTNKSQVWWAWEDLNFRPHAYQARALTN